MDNINSTMEISLENYKNNLQEINKRLLKNTSLMVVVKADAYGHGAIQISKAANEMGIVHFGVDSFDEAVELRRNGIEGEILILGQANPKLAADIEKYDLSVTVSNKHFLDSIPHCNHIKIHIKVDTGLSRNGFYMQNDKSIGEVEGIIANISTDKRFKLMGVFTHFSNSTNDIDFTEKQFSLFSNLIKKLNNKKIDYGKAHCSNSSAMLINQKYHMDMVRIGMLSYGIKYTSETFTVKRVMSLYATLINIKHIKKGDSVGYNRTYVASHDMKLGIVNIGYADGVPLVLSNVGEVMIHGIRTRIIGRISMESMIVDLTPIPKVDLYDKVYLFGGKYPNHITIEEVAKKINTIEYDVMCRFRKFTNRVYTFKEE